MEQPKIISVIVPCKNEYHFIKDFLKTLIYQDYNKKYLEIIIIDNNSDDGTLDIIQTFIKKYKFIKLLINKTGLTTASLNLGIKKAKGEIILRMDIHSLYPEDYISNLVYWLYYLNADNVGGKIKIISKNKTNKGRAIAIACSLPVSVGNVYYRIGTEKIKEVDTIPFGCYKKEVFNKFGLYDEKEFLMNEDDEFNFRLKRAGGKIFLIPDIIIKYFSRDNFSKLFRQYFQYGYWKPKLFKKYKALPGVRHVVPISFILFLFSFPVIFIFNFYNYLYLIILFTYFLLLILFSVKEILRKNEKGIIFIFLIGSIFIIHFSYGLGFFKGIIDFIILNKKVKKIVLSR